MTTLMGYFGAQVIMIIILHSEGENAKKIEPNATAGECTIYKLNK